jgi:hypothetical protein
MPAWLFFLAILLLCPVYVLAEEPAVEKTEDRSPEKIDLSVKMQALLESIDTPEKALQESQKYQQNGQFGLAKIVLLHGIELAEAKGSSLDELTNELEYSMPLLQAKELLVMGQPDQAEEILLELAEKFDTDQKRSDEISALQGALSQSRFLASARRDNERDVTREVRKRLSEFYRQHGVFPSFVELNELLPPEDPVLQNYEIVYFKAVPNAYRLVLRNLHNPENLLKIEATGLIK